MTAWGSGPRAAVLNARSIWHRHLGGFVGCEARRGDLFIAAFGPLPNTNRCAQILAGVLWVILPVKVGEFDAAAVDQRALREIQLEGNIAQLVRLIGLGLRKDLGEERPDRRKTSGGMTGRRALQLGLIALVKFLGDR